MYRGYRTGKDMQLATLRVQYRNSWSDASKTGGEGAPEAPDSPDSPESLALSKEP